MSERPSPERTAELAEQVARGILNVKGSGDSAVAALGELVAALAAETARATGLEQRIARQRIELAALNRGTARGSEFWREGAKKAEAERDALAARLREIANVADERADDPLYTVEVARAALAALQEAPPPDTRSYAQTGGPATWQPETPTLGDYTEAPPTGTENERPGDSVNTPPSVPSRGEPTAP